MISKLKKLLKSFTLVEILIAVGIIAAVSVAAVLVLNPAELLKQSRDSSRILDLMTLNSALATFAAVNPGGFFGLASTTYVSLVDSDATCSHLALPALPADQSYHCATSTANFRNNDGTGWLPINFTQMPFTPPVDQLPVDAVSSPGAGLYYTYSSPGKVWQAEMTAVLESAKYSPLMSSDGGVSDLFYEVGSNLNLAARNHQLLAPPNGPDNPAPTLTSISPNSASVGGPSFTLTVNGLDFLANSIINWNGSPRDTTYITSTQLTAAISALDLTASGTIPVTVTNPAPGGGTSEGRNFSVYQFNPSPSGWATDSSGGGSQGQGNSIAEINGIFYIMAGSGRAFQRYDAISKTWTNMSQMPQSVNNGAVLVKYDNDTLYATRGNGTTDFWQYKISTDIWSTKTSTPLGVDAGGALAYPGAGDFIYLFRGGGTNNFWRYSVSGDSWTAMAGLPFIVTHGGAMTSLGADDIYAFAGGGTVFYRYKISTATWTVKTSSPSAVGNGGSLTNEGVNIYALRGDDTTTFWKYLPLSDAWSQLASTTLPIGVSDGNARGGLVYSQFLNAIYATPGVGNSIMKIGSQ